MNDRGLTQVFVECQAAGCASVLQVVVPSTHRQGNGEVLVRCGKCRRLLRVQLPEELLEPALPPLVPDPTAHMARSPHSSSSSQGQLQPFPSQGLPPPAPPGNPPGGWQQQQQQPSRATPGSSLSPVPPTHQHPDSWAPLPQQQHRDVGAMYTAGPMQGGPAAQHGQLPEHLHQQQQHLNQNQYYQQQQDHVYQDVLPCTADQGPPAPGHGVRRRRPNNAYQEFIRDEMKRLKMSHPGMDHQAAFKMAASTWVTSGAKAAADQAKQDQALAEAARDQRLVQQGLIAQQVMNYGSMVGPHASTAHNLPPVAAPTVAPPAQQPLDSSGLGFMQGPLAAPGQQLQTGGALYTGPHTNPLEFPTDQLMPAGVAAGNDSSGMVFQQAGAAGALDAGLEGHSQQAAAAAADASRAAGLGPEWMSAGQQADWAAVPEEQQQQVAPVGNRLAAPQITPHATAEAAGMTMVATAAAAAAAEAEDPAAVATGGAAVCPEAHLAADTAGTAAGNHPQQVTADEPSQCQTPGVSAEVFSLASPSTIMPPPPPRLGSDSANNNQHAAPQPQPAAAASPSALAPVAATATPSLALTAAGAAVTPNIITSSSSSQEQGRWGGESLTLQETWEALCMKHAPSTPHPQLQQQQQRNPAANPALVPGGATAGRSGQLLQEGPAPGQGQTAGCLATAAIIAAGGTSTQPDQDLLVRAVAGAGSSAVDDVLAVQQHGTQPQQLHAGCQPGPQGAGTTNYPATALHSGPAVSKLSSAAVAEPVGQKPAATPGAAAAAPVLNSEGSSLASWSAGLSHVQTGTAEQDSSGGPAMASPGSLSGAAASTPPSILRHNSAPITTGFLPRQSKAVGYSITTAGPGAPSHK